MKTPLKVLIAEDTEDDALLAVLELRKAGYEVTFHRVETREAMKAALERESWDLFLTDNAMPCFSAPEAIQLLHESDMDIPCIIVSGTMTEDAAVRAMKSGSCDFILKGNFARLAPIVERELREAKTRRQLRRTEDALRESLRRQSMVLNLLPLTLFAGRIRDLGITWITDNAERVTGFPAERFVREPRFWTERIHPEDREGTLAALAVLGEKGSATCEFRWQVADGQWRWFLSHPIVPPSAEAEPGQFIGVWMDVTERKILENQFLQAQKMEAVGQLAAGVAHDFNNLLTVISGYTDLARGRAAGDEATVSYLSEVRRASDRAGTLTRQLLAISRRQVFVPEVLDLNTVVRAAEKMVQRLIGPTIRVETRLEPDPGRVRADPAQIDQVLLNLVVNARDAMPGGGRILIETRNVEPGETATPGLPEGRYVLLAVGDTGQGMDEATRARIFEPFFTTKEKGKGTGLGLATVQSIVKTCGGIIDVESVPGRGTTFRIFLPRIEAGAEAAKVEPEPEEEKGRTRTVLLVEDEEAVRTFLQDVLRAEGHVVLSAKCAGEASEAARNHAGPIDLLMTDLGLPDMNGRDLAVRLVPGRPGMKVMFISGYTAGTLTGGVVLGEDVAFLAKPFGSVEIRAKLRSVFRAGGAPGDAPA